MESLRFGIYCECRLLYLLCGQYCFYCFLLIPILMASLRILGPYHSVFGNLPIVASPRGLKFPQESLYGPLL